MLRVYERWGEDAFGDKQKENWLGMIVKMSSQRHMTTEIYIRTALIHRMRMIMLAAVSVCVSETTNMQETGVTWLAQQQNEEINKQITNLSQKK